MEKQTSVVLLFIDQWSLTILGLRLLFSKTDHLSLNIKDQGKLKSA